MIQDGSQAPIVNRPQTTEVAIQWTDASHENERTAGRWVESNPPKSFEADILI